MDCLIIFDHLNDLIFSKSNSNFEEHIKKLAYDQGLILEEQRQYPLDDNIFIQIFSPIVSSHRIMHFQFGNSYTTVEFNENMNISFCEFMGYLFMAISDGQIPNLIDIYVTFARYLCGPLISQLQKNEAKSTLYTRLINEWLKLRNTDQAMYLEAVEQLVVSSEISSTCLQSLRESISKLSVHVDCSKVHGLLFVENKFLSLYSSSNAKLLSPADILFITTLIHTIPNVSGQLYSYDVLLSSSEQDPKCLPHAVHIVELFENLYLVYLVEVGDASVSAALYECFHHLHRLRFIEAQREKDSIQLGYDNLDLAVKKLNDSLKKLKIKSVEIPHKQFMKKWEILKGKYKEYLKTASVEAIVRAESLAINLLDNLKQLYSDMISNSKVTCSFNHVSAAFPKVGTDLEQFKDFFKVKKIRNFSLGSRDSLTFYKYLEEFPGLVHFIYIDRNTHRLTTSSLDTEAEKSEFIQKRIWSMVSFVRSHLQEGNTMLLWKDNIFSYGYFLWLEGIGGEPIKLTNVPTNNKVPGILGEDYYRKLVAANFPRTPSSKIRIYELFVIHLGLITPSGVLEQSRKLTSTIWELKGFPTHAFDLL